MDDKISLQVIAQLFVEHGAIFVDDKQIPIELKAQGWRSETPVKRTAEGYEVSHLVFAPGEGVEAQCIYEQKMKMDVSFDVDKEGKPVTQMKAIRVYPGKISPPLEDLLAQIEAAQKTLEFEVHF